MLKPLLKTLPRALGGGGVNHDEGVVRQFMDANIADDDVVDAMLLELLSSSDEEEKEKHGGSMPGKVPNKKRDFQGAHNKLIED